MSLQYLSSSLKLCEDDKVSSTLESTILSIEAGQMMRTLLVSF